MQSENPVRRSRSRAARVAALTVLTAAALVVFSPVPASAHTGVQSSTPAADAVVRAAPSEVQLTFGHEVGTDPASNTYLVQVIRDADGRFYSTGCATGEEMTVSAGVALGESGTYSVSARIVTADGHVTTADYGFTYQRPDGAAAATGAVDPPRCAQAAAASTAEPESLFAPYEAPIPGIVIAGIALLAMLGFGAGVLALFWRAARRANAAESSKAKAEESTSGPE